MSVTATVSGGAAVSASVSPAGGVVAASATVTAAPVQAGVPSTTSRPIAVSSSPTRIAAAVTPGVGPQGPAGAAGPQGPSGPPANVVDMEDVLVEDITDGDLLRYSGGKFRNHNETLITDGGNF